MVAYLVFDGDKRTHLPVVYDLSQTTTINVVDINNGRKR